MSPRIMPVSGEAVKLAEAATTIDITPPEDAKPFTVRRGKPDEGTGYRWTERLQIERAHCEDGKDGATVFVIGAKALPFEGSKSFNVGKWHWFRFSLYGPNELTNNQSISGLKMLFNTLGIPLSEDGGLTIEALESSFPAKDNEDGTVSTLIGMRLMGQIVLTPPGAGYDKAFMKADRFSPDVEG